MVLPYNTLTLLSNPYDIWKFFSPFTPEPLSTLNVNSLSLTPDSGPPQSACLHELDSSRDQGSFHSKAIH